MVNRAVMYYNWVPNPLDKEWHRATASGRLHGQVWAGYHDVNEALRYKLDLLQHKGYFCKWIQQPSVYLLNYMEGRTLTQVESLNKAKMQKLPELVRNAILA